MPNFQGLSLLIEKDENSNPIAVVWGVVERRITQLVPRDDNGRLIRVLLSDSTTSTLFNTPSSFSGRPIDAMAARPSGAAINDEGDIYWVASTVFSNIQRWDSNSGSRNFVTESNSGTTGDAPRDVELINTGDSELCSLFPSTQPTLVSTVWRESIGTWFSRRPIKQFERSTDVIVQQWGLPGDVPFYTDSTQANIGVWRPTEGNWYRCVAVFSFTGSVACSGIESTVT